MEKYATRPNHFGPKDKALPDSNVYQTEEFKDYKIKLDNSGQSLGSLNFG